MLNLKSNYFNDYYGNNPDFYSISFLHYNIEIDDYDNEIRLIEKDLAAVKEFSKDLFKIYFSDVDTFISTINDTSIVKEYFNDIYLRINSKDDLEKLSKFNNLKNLKTIIELKDIDKYIDTDINKYSILLQIDNVSELSPSQLINLKERYNVNQIIVGQICYLDDFFSDYLRRIADKFNLSHIDQLEIEKHALISNDNYSIDQYKAIYNELLEVVNEVNMNDSEINKFMAIYNKVINKISYDNEGFEQANDNCQNLIGGLFNNTCVCEGYSKILQQALSLVGIDSIVVGGGGKREDGGHIWDQVKIDNVWYNADSTYDSNRVHNQEPISLCLVDDESLYYQTYYPIAKRCNDKYNFNKFIK